MRAKFLSATFVSMWLGCLGLPAVATELSGEAREHLASLEAALDYYQNVTDEASLHTAASAVAVIVDALAESTDGLTASLFHDARVALEARESAASIREALNQVRGVVDSLNSIPDMFEEVSELVDELERVVDAYEHSFEMSRIREGLGLIVATIDEINVASDGATWRFFARARESASELDYRLGLGTTQPTWEDVPDLVRRGIEEIRVLGVLDEMRGDDDDDDVEQPPPFTPPFVRGDTNADGNVNISDAQFELNFLFVDGRTPPCMKAADANDDGQVDISDAVRILNGLFRGGSAPIPRDCQWDTTKDDLTCREYSACYRIPTSG